MRPVCPDGCPCMAPDAVSSLRFSPARVKPGGKIRGEKFRRNIVCNGYVFRILGKDWLWRDRTVYGRSMADAVRTMMGIEPDVRKMVCVRVYGC